MYTILIVEDDSSISNLIKMNLDDNGYKTLCASDGEEAYTFIEQHKSNIDLILLDIMLPKINGYELINIIRPLDIPVIFLTAKSSTSDKVKGLKLGADDYLSKPFEIMELLARVETVLRRYHKNSDVIHIDDLYINTLSRVVKKDGQTISLTVKEYDLLLLFIKNRNIALFRDQIYENVWGGYYTGDSRTVDLHVQRMRKKVGWENKIVAVYKVGYRLEV